MNQDLQTQRTTACQCTDCPGAGCTCGCQATLATPSACRCGSGCGCEGADQGCVCR